MQKKADYDIYYDSLTEALWFASLHADFDINRKENNFQIIGQRGTNPEIIEKIVAYDKPDIILLKDDKPLLVLETTQEVPTGHNVGQRFARLVRAVELGIPTIYYFPFDAKKHGKFAGLCNMNARLLLAAEKMCRIHQTPLLCVDWPTDKDGEIITDGSENYQIKKILDSYVASGFSKKCDGFAKQLEYMKGEYEKRIKIHPGYIEMPKSITKTNTDAFIKKYHIDQNELNPDFLKREHTYIYKMSMTPANCKRQDPYTGMTFIYDYILCRNGTSVSDKNNNLVLYFPLLDSNTWQQNNPNNPNTKSCNWYLTANMLLFKDGYEFIR